MEELPGEVKKENNNKQKVFGLIICIIAIVLLVLCICTNFFEGILFDTKIETTSSGEVVSSHFFG